MLEAHASALKWVGSLGPLSTGRSKGGCEYKGSRETSAASQATEVWCKTQKPQDWIAAFSDVGEPQTVLGQSRAGANEDYGGAGLETGVCF